MKRTLILPLALPLFSCASYMQREFVIDAVNTQESSVPAVVYMEDEVLVGKESQELRTPATITVRFKMRSDGSGVEGVKLGVKAVKVDEDGRVVQGLRHGDPSEYNEDFRSVYPGDSKRQLFILHRRRAGD